MKRPRSITVARTSAAIIFAAFRATASASISISTFMAVPTLRLEYWSDVFRTQYSSTPILHHSNLSAAHRRVFPASGRRNSLVDFTRSPGTAFVCVHLLRAGITGSQQLGLFANHLLSWVHDR